MRRGVVITGCGVVTAAPFELDRFFGALMAGTCFIGPLRGFTCPGHEAPVGCEVSLPPEDEDARPPPHPSPLRGEEGERGERSRCLELVLAAARRAISDAALAGDLERVGVALGTSMGEERQVGDLNDRWAGEGRDGVDPGFHARSDNHRLPALVARRHGLGGPVLLNATACSSGNAALAWAYELVASGAAEAMLAGGVDTLTRVTYGGFHRMGALSRSMCRPFDRRRDGVSFGEGAALVVLEGAERAVGRGANIHAELAGYGVANDAYHLTAPEPSGFIRAMSQALERARVSPEEVDYVSAHGTGTRYNDVIETRALKAVLGGHAREVPVSSIKSMIGHTNGAAGAVETVACALAMRHQAVPPTANLTDPDPECDLDYVPLRGRSARVDTCLNLSAGFGGSSVALVLRRFA